MASAGPDPRPPDPASGGIPCRRGVDHRQPFNSATFTLLAVVLVHATIRLLDSRRWVAAGAAMILFGWAYPHFLRDASWSIYLYATPFLEIARRSEAQRITEAPEGRLRLVRRRA
jgi:peptidoglycan/LPS O-acetylase OafA/YrhL